MCLIVNYYANKKFVLLYLLSTLLHGKPWKLTYLLFLNTNLLISTIPTPQCNKLVGTATAGGENGSLERNFFPGFMGCLLTVIISTCILYPFFHLKVLAGTLIWALRINLGSQWIFVELNLHSSFYFLMS